MSVYEKTDLTGKPSPTQCILGLCLLNLTCFINAL
jgi:hypothetical protein